MEPGCALWQRRGGPAWGQAGFDHAGQIARSRAAAPAPDSLDAGRGRGGASWRRHQSARGSGRTLRVRAWRQHGGCRGGSGPLGNGSVRRAGFQVWGLRVKEWPVFPRLHRSAGHRVSTASPESGATARRGWTGLGGWRRGGWRPGPDREPNPKAVRGAGGRAGSRGPGPCGEPNPKTVRGPGPCGEPDPRAAVPRAATRLVLRRVLCFFCVLLLFYLRSRHTQLGPFREQSRRCSDVFCVSIGGREKRRRVRVSGPVLAKRKFYFGREAGRCVFAPFGQEQG